MATGNGIQKFRTAMNPKGPGSPGDRPSRALPRLCAIWHQRKTDWSGWVSGWAAAKWIPVRR